MVKKKKKQAEVRPSFAESIGMRNIFYNEKLNFFIGLLLFALAFYFVLSFISFFTTGQADQSLIENLREGELNNEDRKFGNYCGSIGAFTAYFFVKQCFGIPAFFVPAFNLLVWLRLMKAFRQMKKHWPSRAKTGAEAGNWPGRIRSLLI
jgi:S-DNA-T family DNA segregation ATPase FtsK/SpoIIIE